METLPSACGLAHCRAHRRAHCRAHRRALCGLGADVDGRAGLRGVGGGGGSAGGAAAGGALDARAADVCALAGQGTTRSLRTERAQRWHARRLHLLARHDRRRGPTERRGTPAGHARVAAIHSSHASRPVGQPHRARDHRSGPPVHRCSCMNWPQPNWCARPNSGSTGSHRVRRRKPARCLSERAHVTCVRSPRCGATRPLQSGAAAVRHGAPALHQRPEALAALPRRPAAGIARAHTPPRFQRPPGQVSWCRRTLCLCKRLSALTWAPDALGCVRSPPPPKKKAT